jgi:cell volume regulation protein A
LATALPSSEAAFVLLVGGLLALGLIASLVASRLRVPGLVLFLAVGMLVGSEGLGLVPFDNYATARTIGVAALALILFEGGLTTGVLEVRPVLRSAISLALVGTLATAVVVGLTASALFGFSTLDGLLIGAVLSSTDGAAIFALLRGSTLRRNLARTLEAEAGLNDPVAVLLVLGFIEWILLPDYGVADMAVLFAEQLVIGLAIGLAVGWLAVQGFTRARLETAGLYPVVSLAAVALAFGGADWLDGSGFLAVYVAGLVVGTAQIPAKRTVTSFHEGLAWVGQLGMFLTLGLLVFPSQLGGAALEGIVLTLVLVFVARPVGTWLATLPFSYSNAERVVLSWAGLRGAVPIVLATFPVIDKVPDSVEFFNIVFFAVLFSTLVQGSTFEGLARRLGMTTNEPALAQPLTGGVIRRLGAEVLEFPVKEGHAVVGRRVRDLGLPRDAVVNVIVRGDQAIPPRGSTRLLAGDAVHLLLRQEMVKQVPALLERWRHGPIGPPPRPRPTVHGRPSIFAVRPWDPERDGDPARPVAISGIEVIEQLRIRRDRPGSLAALADGRYGISGPLLVIGGREDMARWARRRLATGVSEDEIAWMQTVIAALAADTATPRAG